MAILEIGDWDTRCSACGGNASPDDSAHIHGGPNSGYSKGSSLSNTNGCGEEFTRVEWMYSGDEPPLVREARARIEGTDGPEA